MKTQKHYNQKRMVKLWVAGKSIEEIAQDQDCSTIWARRVVATKAPAEYKAGLEARRTLSGSAPAAPMAKVDSATLAQAVDVIARAVATATFSEAQLVPQPITRAEMFSNISKGVREGVKKLGIGFHA